MPHTLHGQSTARWLYRDALRPAAEFSATGALRSRFLQVGERNVPEALVLNDQAHWLVTDPRGSVRRVVRVSDGVVVEERTYDAWGAGSIVKGPVQPFGFAGGLADEGTGWVRFGARDYDPATKRWTEKDPIRFAGGDTNLYAYVGNDPVNRIDPNGLWVLQVVGTVFGAGAQAWTNYDAYKCGRISAERYAGSIVFGGLVGALSTIPTGVIGGAVAGGLGSGLNEAFNGGMGAKRIDLGDFWKAVAVGAIAGGAANGLGRIGGYWLPPDVTNKMPLPPPPRETYQELGGSIGVVFGTIWSSY